MLAFIFLFAFLKQKGIFIQFQDSWVVFLHPVNQCMVPYSICSKADRNNTIDREVNLFTLMEW